MEFNQNRLRFVHCEHLFNSITEIKHYVRSVQNLRASLYAEPMIFKYGDEKKPCIVLAIGSVGNGKFEFDPEEGTVLNETFYIDFSQAERDITELYKKVGENKAEIERIDGIVKNILVSSGFNEKGEYVPDAKDLILKNAKSLKEADKLLSEYILALEKRQELYVKETATVKSTLEKGETGTTLSSDVKLGTKIFDGRVIDNIIIEQENGIFTSVDLDYVEDESKLVLTINGEDKKDIKLPVEYHVVSGKYDTYTENIILKLNKKIDVNGELTDSININVADLIDEWTVMGEASETPIVLTKEHIKSEELAHEGHHEWQDVLKADIRIVDKATMPDNILTKSSDGKKLFVEGKASNISYMDGNKKITVQEGIDGKISKTSISQNPENTIVYRTDGLYSMIDFDYDSKANKIIFKRTNPKGEVVVVEKELNSLQLIKNAYYDNVAEEIVIVYVDAKGEVQELRIPMQIVVDAFDVDNTDTTVTLTLKDVKPGVNTLKADVNISKQDKNILEDVGHALYVRGTADNIEMIDQTLGKTVEETFTKLNSKLETSVEAEKNRAEKVEDQLRTDLTEEINRAKKAEEELNSKIDTSSRDDKDERDRIERKLDSEIDRSTKEDSRLDEAIKSEKKRAEEIEQGLRDELDAEVIRSTKEDSRLDEAINQEAITAREEERKIRESVATETRERKLADADIQGQLTREIERSTNKDKVLEEQLGLEINRATEKENTIESNLNKEIQDRQDADQAIRDIVVENDAHVDLLEKDLRSLITAEETRATKAEQVNANAITAETEARKVEITRVETKLDGEIKRSNEEDVRLDDVIKEEVKRSTERDEKLASDLSQAKKDLSFIVKNTGTIDLTKVEQEFGSYISGKVNVSGKENNLINKDGEPLFASVDLSYDGDNNKLILSRSGAVDKEIQLSAGSLIESIVYDSERKVLIITYYDSLGNEKHEEVFVGDLFNQWVVETNHLGAVQLTKDINYDGKGRDKLTAEVVVSPDEHNALKNNGGALFVSNQASDIKIGDSNVSDKIGSLEKADVELGIRIDNEIVDRREADTELDTRIDNEVTRATNIENGLRLDLNNEITRSKTEDRELRNNLDNEISRSTETDNTLRSDLTSETNRAIAAEELNSNEISRVETKLDGEIKRSTEKDNNLDSAIKSEKERAEDIEQGLRTDLDQAEKDLSFVVGNTGTIDLTKTLLEIGSKITGKVNVAKGNNNLINDDGSALYANVDITYDAASNKLTLSRSGSDDKVIQLNEGSLIESITYDEKTKELVITYRNSQGESTTVKVNVSDLFNEWGVETNHDGAVKLTKTHNEDGTDTLKAEVKLSEKTDNKLINDNGTLFVSNQADSIILSTKKTVEEKVVELVNEDTRLNSLITAETKSREDEDTRLNDAITAETKSREDEDNRLNDAITAETKSREDAIGLVTDTKDKLTVYGTINKEIDRATIEEKRLNDAITAETKSREDADKALQGNLDAAKNNLFIDVIDTGTVDLTKTKGEGIGSVISAKVRVSTDNGNLINKDGEPLFASVDVNYDAATNKLTLSRSGISDKEIQLNQGTIITNVIYDELTKCLLINHTNAQGIAQEQISVNLTDLFNKWNVVTNHQGGIELIKTYNDFDKTDTLEAKVVISKKGDNKLINDNGALFVSNKAESIILSNNNTVEEKVVELVNEDTRLNNLITAETNTRTNEIARVEGLVTAEENARKDEDARLNDAITAETKERKDTIGLVTDTKDKLTVYGTINKEIDRAITEDARLNDAITAETKSREDADKALQGNLDAAKNNLFIDVANTGTVDLTKTKGEGIGSVISAKVNVSKKENNLINKDGEPLFASVDVNYDAATNKLTLSRSGSDDKVIQLNEGSLINSITYDEHTKELVIKYTNAQGEIQTEIRVKVDDLFNEWKVEEGNHLGAVQLTKVRQDDGVDILSASVIISPDEHNALKNNGGALFVSNQASDIKIGDSNVSDKIENLLLTDAELRGLISTEKTNRVNEDSRLEGLITAEETRATKAEQVNANAITAETNTRKNEITRVEGLISAETTNRIAADKNLNEEIAELKNEVNSARTDLTFSVEDTHTIDLSKVKDVNGNNWILSGKVLVSTQSDNLINNDGQALYASVDVRYNETTNILTLVKSKGNGENSGIIEKTIPLNSGSIIKSIIYNDSNKKLEIEYIDAKNNNHTEDVDLSKLYNNFIVYNDALSAVELTKNDNFDGKGNSKLSAKVKISDKGLLKNDSGVLSVSNSANDIILSGDVTVSSAIEALKNSDDNLNSVITTETNTRKNEITRVEGLISAETTNRIAADEIISTNVSNNKTNLTNEINRALGAEDKLRNDLQKETERANEADSVLKKDISNEHDRAITKEGELESAIATEKGRATLEEANLSKRISEVEAKSNTNKEKIDSIVTDVENVVKTYAMSVEDTTTIDLTKKPIDAGGFIVSADVKVSSNLGNTIIKQADGIFSNVDLTYDEPNNTLHFKRNDKTVDFVLNTVSTIESITYDSITDEIVIKYKGKNGDVLETRFPAKSLFKPIQANNDGKNIELEVKQVDGVDTISGNLNFANCINNEGKNIKLSVTDNNKLAAEAVISTLPNNGLIKDEQSGALFVSNLADDIKMCAPEKYGENVCEAITNVDDKVNGLEEKFNKYYDEQLLNSMNRDIINLKSKTNIEAVDTPSIDLKFRASEDASKLQAWVFMSNDPHNLITVYDDTFPHNPVENGRYPEDTYNGLRFDGNIDYQLFTTGDEGTIKKDVIYDNDKFSDWTRHLQMKRNDGVFETRKEALAFLHRPDFLADKKDGEPLVARYKNGEEISFILGFVRISEEGEVQIQTVDNKGTTVDKMEYVPNAKDITATDEFGIQTVTHVPAESLYVEFTDTSSLKHSIVVPLKELVEEYTYPESVSTFDGQLGKSDGETVKEHHNVKFDVERHEDNKSIIKADIDFYDCGEYGGEDFIK